MQSFFVNECTKECTKEYTKECTKNLPLILSLAVDHLLKEYAKNPLKSQKMPSFGLVVRNIFDVYFLLLLLNTIAYVVNIECCVNRKKNGW